MTDRAAAEDLPRLSTSRSGSGPCLTLVHGYSQSGASWSKVTALLAGGHEVLTPDLPGHGGSPPATGDLHSAASQLGNTCGRSSYVGYSLGGRICLHLALDRPVLVERLVLVSASAGIEDVDEREARRQADEQLASRIEEGGDEGVEGFLDEWLAGPLFARLSGEAADRPSRLVNTAAGLASSLRAHGVGGQMPLWERLSELSMPVLVVAGSEDPKFVDLGERMTAAVGANASFVLAPGAGHAVPFEQPEAFARLVADFVARRVGDA